MIKQESDSGRVNLEVEWRARFAGSGQQVKKFCKSESVSAAAFYRWRKPLDQDAFPVNALRFIDVGALGPTAPSEAPSATSERIFGAALEVHLDLGHGLTLHIVRR